MPVTYRRPGVYLTESVLPGSSDVGFASSVAVFVGAAAKGNTITPVQCNSWVDYTTNFGGFDTPAGTETAYLPYAVWQYFQNGGNTAYVMRATGADGTASSFDVTGTDSDGAVTSFVVQANSTGSWAGTATATDPGLSIELVEDVAGDVGPPFQSSVFSLLVYSHDGASNLTLLETFTDLSMDGSIPGTKAVDAAVNDSVYGSAYIEINSVVRDSLPTAVVAGSGDLVDGVDATLPVANDLNSAAEAACDAVDGPIILNIAPHRLDGGSLTQSAIDPNTFNGGALSDRGDIFSICDNVDAREPGDTAAEYISGGTAEHVIGTPTPTDTSYAAFYTPWLTIPNPAESGGTISVPPGGSVAGVYARTDATRGVFKAPAGVNAAITNAINVDTVFSVTQQGDLNASNINVIRPVKGAGISIMGARTRKTYGTDRYVNARRTLIYIKESIKDSTQFAVFENNDQRLWTRLTSTADRILRPIWSEGGLRGANKDEAYYIVCDDTINTPQVIQNGEVRMEIGVALEYPAEFIVIRLSQYEGGADTEIIS